MAFLRLTGRFPNQQPLELLPDVLAFVVSELALALASMVIEAYAQRQATVSAHQKQIRLHLGFRAFDPAEREALSHFLREEALHLDHLAALIAQAEAFLRDLLCCVVWFTQYPFRHVLQVKAEPDIQVAETTIEIVEEVQ